MIYLFLLFVFILGAFIGSWLNVCIGRIPYERSIVWPSSRCDSCFAGIKWYDNLPLLSYLILRGRCRHCNKQFSSRHFWLEMLTGLGFALVFLLDVIVDVHDRSGLPLRGLQRQFGLLPARIWILWGCHVTLLSFLIVTSFIDLEHFEIPLSVTMTGVVVGLILSTIYAWPWPESQIFRRGVPPRLFAPSELSLGLQLWPVWYPLPAWAPPGSWQLGLLTGLAGVLAAMLLLRVIRFLFQVGRGIEGLGLGDADLMMMVGAFIGWQAVLIAFFVSVIPALIFGVGNVILTGRQALAFGPCLALGSLLTLFGWRYLPDEISFLFFDAQVLLLLSVVGAIFLVLISFFLRFVSGPAQPQQV